MTIHRLARLAAVVFVVAGLCSVSSPSQAAPLAAPNSPASSPIAGSSCSLPDFLSTSAPAAISTNLFCGCGDSICGGQSVLTPCGTSKVCVSIGFCSNPTFRRCSCTTLGSPGA